ncbi:MAG: hypothetical protein ACD_16C00091G0001 [uncultured bacterium]|nr:MAG: hypothetical protein ACD_16C00091G0001 [uncultured bacterium]
MAIVRRFEILLENKLGQLFYQGHVVLERWELLTWAGRDRLTNVVWRDIEETWAALFEAGRAPVLKVIKCDETTAPQRYVLVNSKRLKDLSSLS